MIPLLQTLFIFTSLSSPPRSWACQRDSYLFFLKSFRELRSLFATCCRSCSIFFCAFQAGHQLPCQDMILPVTVSGFSLAYRHSRHPSHALPRNCSNRFICNLQCGWTPKDRVAFLISLFRSTPELAGFTHSDKRCDPFLQVFSTSGHPIRIKTLAEIAPGEEFQQIFKRYYSFLSTFFELRPTVNMIFRPEEIHCASGIRNVVPPFPQRNRHIGGDAFRIGMKYSPVSNLYGNGESAVQTWAIDANSLTWKKPADRQRFEASLAKPLLPTVHRNRVVSG